MAWIQEYAFRGELLFVTDIPPTIFVDHTVSYPQVHPVDGNNYGWDDNSVSGNISSRDRNAGLDPRLAGYQFLSGTSDPSVLFTVELPAADDYEISFAIGEINYGFNATQYRILDNATQRHAASLATTAGKWFDATDTERTSAANWVANQAPAVYTFASTFFRIEISDESGGGRLPLAWLRIERVESGAQIGDMGRGDEIDSGFALGRVKKRAAGMGVELDSGLALGRVKKRSADVGIEVDSAFALTRKKIRADGMGVELDSGIALPRVKIRAMDMATETNSAFALGRIKTRSVGMGTETDVGLALGRVKSRSVAIATETDVGLELARLKKRNAGIGVERDYGFALAAGEFGNFKPGVRIGSAGRGVTSGSRGRGLRSAGTGRKGIRRT